jgi:superoxide dismutase, Fe-Mn family
MRSAAICIKAFKASGVHFLPMIGLCLTLLPLATSASHANAQLTTPPTSAPTEIFTLPALPYAYNALEPIIDARTMELHHQRHQGAQVRALNEQANLLPELRSLSLEQILSQVSRYPASVRNNAGGHYNHTLFWRIMAPVGQGGAPSTALAQQITRDFGSMEALRQQFSAAANQRFGSGWAWLIWRNGKLEVTSTANQDNPLMDVVEVRGTPILALDVWEHAYYLMYQNRRGDYVSAWWPLINWVEVNERFALAAAPPPSL